MSNPAPAEAYGGLAWAYDQALGRVFHQRFEPVLDRILRREASDGGSHLDLACGTSIPASFLRSRGFTGIGLDASISMLSLAKPRQRSLVCADFRAIPFAKAFDLVTAFYDSLNHVLDREDLDRVFREAARILRSRGLLVFDVNHRHAFEDVWGSPEPYTSRGDDHEISIFTSYDGESRMAEATISGWVSHRGKRRTVDETRTQRAWDEEELREAIEDAGMAVVGVEPFDPFPHPAAVSRDVKLIFVVRGSED